ncbi:sulfate/molybdate ABC transporter ATP-binding protein [Mannheimia varigena]|uniref:sulfate/molybdate ABC transporter ATP-binding protein n=1 Tax=Mannheimia varigena TaxID=85404 RepID=UPI0015B386D6|nr:sulfate ABC transporter ATP-binding protein [Mannheimia varigena]QLD32880.1 TOBE-like domain-containing protein [Mannheimia varigena]
MTISIHHLNKQFGQTQVLHDINLTINNGELVALLGPSGCGKTTLLRIIAGLETASSGKILFDQNEVTQLSAKERDIGFVFQHYALFRHMTIADNIAFGLRMKPKSERLSEAEIQAKVKHLLELIQLEHIGKRYPDQLSGGQRQRVALARAIATEPKVLLLDEPFGALDAKVRKDLRRWLRDFHHEMNVTSLFVTHDQDEALEVADKIVLMNKGKVEQIGSPEQVYKQPRTAFVADFLGDVNLLHGYIFNGMLHIDKCQRKVDSYYSAEDVVVYVRPHEIAISKNKTDNTIVGRVQRIHTAGPTVEIEVLSNVSDLPIDVSVSYNQFLQEGFTLDEEVYLEPQLLNFFIQNELIEYMI